MKPGWVQIRVSPQTDKGIEKLATYLSEVSGGPVARGDVVARAVSKLLIDLGLTQE